MSKSEIIYVVCEAYVMTGEVGILMAYNDKESALKRIEEDGPHSNLSIVETKVK